MTLILTTKVRNEIEIYCEDSFPQEACGLLIGHSMDDVHHVDQVVHSQNVSSEPEKTFEIDPELIISAQKNARNIGQKIIGHFHSHPGGRAEPSRHDQEQNYDLNLYWVIVQVLEGQCSQIKAFSTDQASGKLQESPMDVIPSQ